MQEVVESGATHVGRIATILTGAVRDVTREVGSWATDLFEMREASQRARADRESTDRESADGDAA